MHDLNNFIFFRISLPLLLSSFSFYLQGQDRIQGIVNNYASVIEIQENCTIICDSTNGFNANDRLLIIQMKGASIDTVNNENYGTVTNFGNAGIYEIASIQTVVGDTIFLRHELIQNYDVENLVQVVGIPKYSNVEVTDEIYGREWNGKKGGVIFLEASNEVLLQANINGNAIGFNGGAFSNSADVVCSYSDYYTNFDSGDGGKKGESIIKFGFNDSGRGALASGGGGGNNHNSGGGGGSNFGNGGIGGKQAKGCGSSAPNVGGLGGKPYNYAAIQSRLFLGGGGGGGHQNKSTQASDGESSFGGHGGGIVVISTKNLVHNGNTISANGQSVTDIAENDGAGGGGAGGTIFLNIDTLQDNLTVTAIGGDGGDVDNAKRLNDYHGPGGGGGGGVIYISTNNNPKLSADVTGGDAGILYFSNNPNIVVTGGENYGATDGTAGGIINEIAYPEGTVACPIKSNFRAQNIFLEIIAGQDITFPVDPETDTLALQITDGPFIGQIPSITNNTVSYQSNPNETGIDSIQYTLCTTNEPIICNSAWIYITLLPDNRKVEAVNDTVIIVDAPADISLNDTIDTNVIYEVISPPTSGDYTLSQNGILDYHPLFGYQIPDTLTYRVCTIETPVKCDTATVFINTTLTNLPPNALPDSVLIEQNKSVSIDPIVNDTDADGDSIFIISVEQPANGTAILVDGLIEYTPDVGFTGTDSIIYTISDSGNPAYTSETVIIIQVINQFDIEIPTGISPNGDGINDFLVIEGLDFLPDNTLKIFNRWGEEIYVSTPYNNDWDGTNNQGAPLPDGTYFFVFTSEKIEKNYSGYVIIHR